MRRALALATLVLLCAAPATAQEAVRGGTSFRRAPVLDPGEHRDTIRPGETLFYAVDAGEDKVLTVRAILRTGDRAQPLETRLRVYNSQRVEDAFAQDAGFLRPPGTLGLHARSGRIGPPSVDYPEAGTHYFSVSVAPRPGVATEIDLSLGVNVKAAPEQAAVVVSTPPPSRTPPAEPRGGTYLVAALGGALFGGVATFLASKLRQPPSGLRHRL